MSTKKSKKKNLSGPAMGNIREFGRASKACKLISTAFHQQLADIKDSTQKSRLISKLTQVIQSDPLNGYGQRTASAGDLRLLEGFDFCLQQPLLRLFPVRPALLIDREPGQCIVYFPSFIPSEEVNTKTPITHIQLTAVAAELDFEQERFEINSTSSDLLRMDKRVSCALECTIPFDSLLPIVLAIGIRLFQVINGVPYEVKQGGKPAFQIVKGDSFSPSINPPSSQQQRRTKKVAVKAVIPGPAFDGHGKLRRKASSTD